MMWEIFGVVWIRGVMQGLGVMAKSLWGKRAECKVGMCLSVTKAVTGVDRTVFRGSRGRQSSVQCRGSTDRCVGGKRSLLQGQQGKTLSNTLLWASNVTHEAKGRP